MKIALPDLESPLDGDLMLLPPEPLPLQLLPLLLFARCERQLIPLERIAMPLRYCIWVWLVDDLVTDNQ